MQKRNTLDQGIQKLNSGNDKPSLRFISGIFGFCVLIFVCGLSAGMHAKKCTCPGEANSPAEVKPIFEIVPDTLYPDRATTYQATIEQCDSTPFSTASGAKINPDHYQKWCAVSRDLHSRWGGPLDFGDTISVLSEKNPNFNGKWVVQDLMAPSYKNSIDFLLEAHKNYPKLGIGKDFKIWKN